MTSATAKNSTPDHHGGPVRYPSVVAGLEPGADGVDQAPPLRPEPPPSWPLESAGVAPVPASMSGAAPASPPEEAQSASPAGSEELGLDEALDYVTWPAQLAELRAAYPGVLIERVPGKGWVALCSLVTETAGELAARLASFRASTAQERPSQEKASASTARRGDDTAPAAVVDHPDRPQPASAEAQPTPTPCGQSDYLTAPDGLPAIHLSAGDGPVDQIATPVPVTFQPGPTSQEAPPTRYEAAPMPDESQSHVGPDSSEDRAFIEVLRRRYPEWNIEWGDDIWRASHDSWGTLYGTTAVELARQLGRWAEKGEQR